MTLLLGVDGGNSKSIALVATADGSIVAAARRLGSADIYSTGGVDAAIELIRTLVHEALTQAGAGAADIGKAVFSMAGADWPEDFALLGAAFGREGFAQPPLIVNDAIGALSGAVPDGPAVVVSLGTGAATGARGADGSTWHSSFWQSPQGAGELAHRSITAVVRAEMGVGAPTALRERLLAATGDDRVEAVLHRFTARDRPMGTVIGAVVRALFKAARDDAVAKGIVVAHGTGIGEVAGAAARRVGIERESYALSFCGGLARAAAEPLIDAAVDAVRAAGQSPRRVEPRWQPAVGALSVALRMSSDVAEWPGIADRLDATAPPEMIYDLLPNASDGMTGHDGSR